MPKRPNIPLFSWARDYPREALRGDLTAGVTVAVLVVPQALAYAVLAGMPPVTGLYTTVAASLVYAAVGTSRHLGVGPVALTALLVAAALGEAARGDPARVLLLGPLLAVLVGVIQWAMRLLRLSALVNFLSHSVLAGFTSAAGITIAATQLKDLLGLPPIPGASAGLSLLDVLRDLLPNLVHLHGPTTAIGVASLLVLLLGRRLPRIIPVPLVVTVAATLLSTWVGVDGLGVRTLRELPAGFPIPRLPVLDSDAVRILVPFAGAIALISFMEAIGQGKAIAARQGYHVSAGRELLALGGMNVAAGLFGGFPAGASYSRTALTLVAGGRTQLSGLVAAVIVLVAIQVAAPVLAPLPRTALAAIVVASLLGLIDFDAIRRTWRVRRTDGMAVIVTFLATLVLGVGPGIATGVLFSLFAFVVRAANPRIVELGRVDGTAIFRDAARFPVNTDPSVLVLRMDAPLYFANAEFLRDRVEALVARRPALRTVLLNCATIGDVDADGVRTLEELSRTLQERDIRLVLVLLRGPVRDILARSGFLQKLVEEGRYGRTVQAVLDSLDLPPDSPLLYPAPDEVTPSSLF